MALPLASASPAGEAKELIVVNNESARAPLRFDLETETDKIAKLLDRAKHILTHGIPARQQNVDASNNNPPPAVVNQGRAWRNVGIAGLVIGSTVTALFLVTILAATVPSFSNAIAKSSSTGLKITELLSKHNALGVAVGGLAVGALITSGGTVSMIWYRKGIAKINQEKEAIARQLEEAEKGLKKALHDGEIAESAKITTEIQKISEIIKGQLDGLRAIKQKIYARLEQICNEIGTMDASVTDSMKEADLLQIQRLFDNLDKCERLATEYKLAPETDVRLPETTARAFIENESFRTQIRDLEATTKALNKRASELEGRVQEDEAEINELTLSNQAQGKVTQEYLHAKANKNTLKKEFADKDAEVRRLEAACKEALAALPEGQTFDNLPPEHQLKKDKVALEESEAALGELNRRLDEATQKVVQTFKALEAANKPSAA